MGVGPRCPCGGALKSELRSMWAKDPKFADVPSRYRCKRCGKRFQKFKADTAYSKLVVDDVVPDKVVDA
jgi:hypothetical protein